MTIDNLEIEITSSSKEATTAIGKLIGALTHLQGIANNFKGFSKVSSDVAKMNKAISDTGMAKAADGAKKLVNSLDGVKKAANEAGTAVGKMSSNNILKDAQASSFMSRQQNQRKFFEDQAKKAEELRNSNFQLVGETTGAAAHRFDLVGDTKLTDAKTLSEIEKTGTALAVIPQQYALAIREVDKMPLPNPEGLTVFQGIAEALGGISKGASEANMSMGQFVQYLDVSAKQENALKALRESHAKQNAFDQYLANGVPIGAADMTKFNANYANNDITSNAVNVMSLNSGFGRLAETAMQAKQALEPMGSLLGMIGQAAGKASVELGKMAIVKPIQNLANSVKGLHAQFGKFLASVKRIAIYRAIRAALKMVNEAMTTGVQNVAQYSKALGNMDAGHANATLSQLATTSLQLKNSIGAALIPIINMVAPMFYALAGAVMTAVNAINRFFAILGGQTSWTKATSAAVDYADAVGGAGKANKDFSKTIGIDELNVLDPNSGGGGGGGGGMPNPSEMFEEVALTADQMDFAQKFKDAIDRGDWEGAGRLLGAKLNEMIANLDAYGFGQKVGTYINNGIKFAYGFIDELNFTLIGQKIAEFLNGAMGAIDFNTAGRLVAAWFLALPSLIIGLIENLDWHLVGNSISDFFSGAFDYAFEWFSSTDFRKLGNDLYTALHDLIVGIDFGAIASSFFRLLGVALGSAGALLVGFVEKIVFDIRDYFLQFIEDENGDGKFGGAEIIKGVLEGMWEAIKNIGTWIKENIFDPFVEGFKSTFGIASPAKEMKPLGQYVVDGFLEGISEAWSNITEFFGEKLDLLKEKIQKTWDDVKQWTYEKWLLIKKYVIDPVVQLKKDVETKIEELKTNISNAWEAVREWTAKKWEEIKGCLPEPVQAIVEKVGEVITKAGELKDAWDTAASNIATFCGNMTTAIAEFARNSIQNINDVITKLGELDHTDVDAGMYSMAFDETGVAGYATGGYPTPGELFYANENGTAEYIGSMGGRTAVANNDQIVAGISQGVASANGGVIAALNQLIGVVDSKEMSVNIGDNEIGRSYDRYNMNRGVRVSSGAFANAY